MVWNEKIVWRKPHSNSFRRRANREEGTIRKKYAESKGRNAVHGSDSDENAQIESNFHFSENEII